LEAASRIRKFLSASRSSSVEQPAVVDVAGVRGDPSPVAPSQELCIGRFLDIDTRKAVLGKAVVRTALEQLRQAAEVVPGREADADPAAFAAAPAVKSQKQDAKPKRAIRQAVIETLAAVKTQFPKSAFMDGHAAWYRSRARKGWLTGTPVVIPAQRQSKSGN